MANPGINYAQSINLVDQAEILRKGEPIRPFEYWVIVARLTQLGGRWLWRYLTPEERQEVRELEALERKFEILSD